MKNTFKTVASTLLTNWSPLLWFEVLFRFIWVYAFYPLYQFLLNGAYKIAGIYYVSQYNIFLIFKTPVTFLILFCILLFFAYFVYFEMCAIILCCEKGWRGEKISSLKLWKNAFFKSLRLFHYKNFPLFLLFLPLLGISLFGITSSFLANFRVPDFILSFIQDHTLLLLCLYCRIYPREYRRISVYIQHSLFNHSGRIHLFFFQNKQAPFKRPNQKSGA